MPISGEATQPKIVNASVAPSTAAEPRSKMATATSPEIVPCVAET